MKYRWFFTLLIACTGFSLVFGQQQKTLGQTDIKTGISYFKDSEFDWYFRSLIYSTWQKPAQPIFSNFEEYAHRRIGISIRPDFYWDSQHVNASIKPRINLYSFQPQQGDKSYLDLDVFIHQWETALNFYDQFTASYSLKTMLWGPSQLLSPSNPFQAQNGRNNPKEEMDASYYAQLGWMPNETLAFTFMINTDEGNLTTFTLAEDVDPSDPLIPTNWPSILEQYNQLTEFKETYALKADWTGEQKDASLIASVYDDDVRLGAFGHWNLNDALMMYSELGWQKDDTEVLVGTSYTFNHGGMLTAEYFFNQDGDRDENPIELLYQSLSNGPRELLLRQNYVLLQYTQPMIHDVLDITARWMGGLDDNSHIFLLFSDWGITDNIELFANTSIFSGDADTEFGTLLEYTIQAGFEVSF